MHVEWEAHTIAHPTHQIDKSVVMYSFGFLNITSCFTFTDKSMESQKDTVTEKNEDSGDDNDIWKKLKDFAG